MRKTRTLMIAAGLGAVLASSLPASSPASETRVIVALVSEPDPV
jgi:hypothetical protein